MSYFPEMELNGKWDWENTVGCGSKTIEGFRKLQLADWMVVDDGEMNAGSFNLSGGGWGGPSGSDGGYVTSAKSSISASPDSSIKNNIQVPNFRLAKSKDSGNFSEKMDMKGGVEFSGTFPPLEAFAGSVEPRIGLKLGKRTYFENGGTAGNLKTTSFSATPSPSSSSQKKSRPSGQNVQVPRCQVEGCSLDLSMAKEYHRKHRVCDIHSKCPKVVVGGLDRRFCQQCSRFHGLSEFDEKKRSCRRRLSDHNARRRKPPQETIQFKSTKLSSPCYGGVQANFLLNNAPQFQSGTSANCTWNSSFNSKFTITKEYPLKCNEVGGADEQLRTPVMKLTHEVGGADEQLRTPVMKLTHANHMRSNTVNELLAPKSSTDEILNPGPKGALFCSQVDEAPEYDRALSLLSSNSWGSCVPESNPLHHPMHVNDMSISQLPMPSIPEGVPLFSEIWLTGQQCAHPRVQSSLQNNHFPDIHCFKTPYEADFYSNLLN